MQPTTDRYRVHGERPDDEPGDAGDELVLIEVPDEPVAPDDPGAADAYEPIYVASDGYEGDLADDVAALEPGYVVEADLDWTDSTARFVSVDVVRETRLYVADDVEGMFEAATDAWQEARAAGEAMVSRTTRSSDGDPNGALYLFADGPNQDTLAGMERGAIPIEPLIGRVNARRDDGEPRAVFLLRPAAHDFVAVYVVFDRDGVLAQTVKDTYGLGGGLADELESAGPVGEGGEGGKGGEGGTDAGGHAGADEEFDLDDSLRNL